VQNGLDDLRLTLQASPPKEADFGRLNGITGNLPPRSATGSMDADLLLRSWRFPLVNTTPSGWIYRSIQNPSTSAYRVIRAMYRPVISDSPETTFLHQVDRFHPSRHTH
jgi:hypothetical protein